MEHKIYETPSKEEEEKKKLLQFKIIASKIFFKVIKLFSAPFIVNAKEVDENLQFRLIKKQSEHSLKNQPQLLSLPDFYWSLEKAKSPLMRRHTKRMMSMFGSTYTCVQTLSLITLDKSKFRTKMIDSHICDVLRISTSKLTPDLPAILQAKIQHHCFH